MTLKIKLLEPIYWDKVWYKKDTLMLVTTRVMQAKGAVFNMVGAAYPRIFFQHQFRVIDSYATQVK
jgi:hypothetical protein